LGTLLQPVHVEPCDLNSDGEIDLVVADIGEFDANESDLGRVVWLKRKPGTEDFQKIVLLDGLSRTSDVQPGDFDGDGDTDLLVAAFGWRKTGRILLMVNQGESKTHSDGRPEMVVREIDPRPGAVNVTPIDLNGDGHLDFIALLSQEHEVVEVFLNDGAGNFQNELLYAAPDPAYGSSGIELVDIDGDDDIDVLYTNGDSFDRGPKPFHSVQWLENEGKYPFRHHHLANFPGVLNAQAGDFDNDGDIDIVAGSLLGQTVADNVSLKPTSSILLIEQTQPKQFRVLTVEAESHFHLSMEVGDFDDNGAPDFAVGNFMRYQSPGPPDITIYWNR
jgi:hypothetical protein